MSEEAARLIVHGAPASQPSRAVYWACMIKGIPFELKPLGVGDMGRDGPLLRLNPSGQIPILEDGAFAIYEMPAILIYLCEKFGWDDLLPADLSTRARVHQYLHFHHNFTRRATMELMAPHVTVAFPDRIKGTPLEAKAADPDKLETGRAVVRHLTGLIESASFPDGSAHLCAAHATIADIACYEELAQLRWAGLFDFEGFPKIQSWLAEMEHLPCHEQAHRYNIVLGDIRSEVNTLERFLEASAAGVAALDEES
jgi:glutathione S-transferase